MYTAMPRAELVGTARFVDKGNRLCCEVVFGKVPGAEHPLLQRTDSCQAEMFVFSEASEGDVKVCFFHWLLLLLCAASLLSDAGLAADLSW